MYLFYTFLYFWWIWDTMTCISKSSCLWTRSYIRLASTRATDLLIWPRIVQLLNVGPLSPPYPHPPFHPPLSPAPHLTFSCSHLLTLTFRCCCNPTAHHETWESAFQHAAQRTGSQHHRHCNHHAGNCHMSYVPSSFYYTLIFSYLIISSLLFSFILLSYLILSSLLFSSLLFSSLLFSSAASCILVFN